MVNTHKDAEFLAAIAAEKLGEPISADRLENPDFSEGSWRESWEFYVDESLQDCWPRLSLSAKWAACIAAISDLHRELEYGRF